MKGEKMLIGLSYIDRKFIEESENDTVSGKKLHESAKQEVHISMTRTIKRPLLIAVIIALLMLLVGCVAYFYNLEHLVVVDHTKENVSKSESPVSEQIFEGNAETMPETAPGPFVVEKVLSMQGYEGSPAYNALQEWSTYVRDYIIHNPECRFSDDFHRPEAYRDYTCYSQEMVDKVDEICSKYGLHILGKSEFIMDAEGMEANGLSGVLYEDVSPRCFYGHLYQDGSFVASGELELSGDYEKIVQFQMHNIKEGCLLHRSSWIEQYL